jgi:hypothetical protein
MRRGVLTFCALGIVALATTAPAPAATSRQLPALTAVGHDALSRVLARGELTEARYSLERARSLFALETVRREFGDVARPSPRSATLLLRDLMARVHLLAPADQLIARRILARPTDSNDLTHRYRNNAIVASVCDATRPLCFHWDERVTNRDSFPDADGNPRTIPADVQATIKTFRDVYDLEVETYGYLAPLPDSSSADDGGDAGTDIYLADLGGDRVPLFGYCTSDDPNAFDQTFPYVDVSAYCVLDEDFSQQQFGNTATQQGFRAVTAAHEFFHAIQFHYDSLEDLWLMEGTAMFMEDQFADGVNDNVRYLEQSVIVGPGTPVDRGGGGFEYGAWIWWRFLAEDLDEQLNPLVIRRVWERVAGASIDTDGAGGPDTVASNPYSLQGVVRVLRARGLALKTLFGKFAWANRVPFTVYEEGGSYPKATVERHYTLGKRGTGSGWHSVALLHLASTYASFKPGASTPLNAALRVRVDLPDSAYSPQAFLLVKERGQPWRTRAIGLDSSGNGARSVVFGRRQVREVVLVLTNASARMRCDRRTEYSCAGVGRDDGRAYSFRGRVR